MKRASILITIILSLCISILMPFSVYADVDTTGFDYTNYYQLSYIQSTGSQYINLGFGANEIGRVQTEVKFANNNRQILMAAYESSGYAYVFENYAGSFRIVGSGMSVTSGSYAMNADTFYNVNISLNLGKISFNGYEQIQTSGYFTATRSLYLFASNDAGDGAYLKASATLKYLTIWDKNGNLTHNYVPAERKSDNKIGLYDTVTSTFNSGYGTFLGGSRVVTYSVSASISPSGSGSVSGTGSYVSGTTATLTATPSTGYHFVRWSDNSTTNPRSVLVSDNISLTAYFEQDIIPVTQYTVTTSVSPSGSGSVSGGGTYDEGTSVTLTATPSSGYVFTSWSNGSTANPYTFTLNDDISLQANFSQEQVVTTYNVSLSVDPTGAGSVSGGGTYASGTSVTITATPSSGYDFLGWYINNSLLSRNTSYSLTIDQDYSIVAKFQVHQEDEPSGSFTPWTDENDSKTLQEITSSYTANQIGLNITKRLVIDSYVDFIKGLDFSSGMSGAISFTGTYSNNQFQGIQACNSTGYEFQNTTYSPGETITIHPWISGSIGTPIGSLNFGVEVEDVNISGSSSHTSVITNTSQACAIIGTNPGDSNIDASMWDTLGYHAVTTYSDVEGYQATVWVPDDQDIQFSTYDFDTFFDNLYAYVQHADQVVYHYEYDVSVYVPDGYLLPEYGYINTKVPLGLLLNIGDQQNNEYFKNVNASKYSLLENSDPFYGNNTFHNNTSSVSGIGSNVYTGNSCTFRWYNNNNPEWHFSSNSYKSKIFDLYANADNNGISQIENLFSNNNSTLYYKDIYGDPEYTALTSTLIGNISSLTEGYYIQTFGINDYKLYTIKDNSLLNRFNQLGAMLDRWFTRLYNSLSNITGGSESNDITNNITNEYDIDVDTNINNVITNVTDIDNDIDLTIPEFTISNDHLTNISHLSTLVDETYDAFDSNGLSVVILLPVIITILGLIL